MTKRTGAAKKHKGGVLLEDLDSKLDLVLEGQQGLGVRVGEVDKKVDNLKQDMDYKFEIVFDELRLIRNELKEKVGRDEFIVLEKRVAHLEKKIGHRA
jgi:hypothetical protein